jgi:hypothetical protein
MVFSCLVQPLVTPLVRRGAVGGQRRTALGSRLLSTALMASALVAVAVSAQASAAEKTARSLDRRPAAEQLVRNAHKKPEPLPLRLVLAAFARRDDLLEVVKPGLASELDQALLRLERARPPPEGFPQHPGPGLWAGKRLDRLLASRSSTFLRFGAGRHLSGAPNPA